MGPVLDRGHDLAVGRAVGAEPVRDNHSRHRACFRQQRAEEAPGSSLVPAALHENVEHVAIGVDGPPQVLQLTADHEDLVQVPLVARLHTPAAQACPNFVHQRRTVSWETSTPRSSINSSTSRNDSGKRKYSHTQWEMISTGYRCPFYDGGVLSTDDTSQHDQSEDHLIRSANVTVPLGDPRGRPGRCLPLHRDRAQPQPTPQTPRVRVRHPARRASDDIMFADGNVARAAEHLSPSVSRGSFGVGHRTNEGDRA